MPDEKTETKTEQQSQEGQTGGEKQPETYEAWLEGQPAEVKTLLDTHTQGLKSALDSERGTRKDLEKQVRDLAGKAEKGSEAEAQLTKLADDLANEGRRADFYQSAHAAGISDLRLAYLVAVQDEMFDKRGAVNFEELKRTYPLLFGGKPGTPPGNAGAGTGSTPAPPVDDVNAAIRRAANR